MSPIGQAALDFARRGWPVFPCNEKNGRPLVGGDKDAEGKAIPNTGGLHKATCDERQIEAWWRKWPRAQIGLHSGDGGLLHVDFDPRVDELVDAETGEVTRDVWTVERLKAALLAQMGVALPPTLVSLTPSGGEHHWFLMPAGEPIGNSGALPRHIDVRGQGGYVITPPSARLGDLDDGGKKGPGAYTWLHGDWTDPAAVLPAPPELVAVLRERKRPARSRDLSVARSPAAPMAHGDADEAQRRYALRALDEELLELERTPEGGGRHGRGRNYGIYQAALKLGGFVQAGALRESVVRAGLEAVVRAMPNNADLPGALAAIENGFENASPRDLSAVGVRTTRGRDSGHSFQSLPDDRPSPPPAAYEAQAVDVGDPPTRRRPLGDSQVQRSSHDGRVDDIASLKGDERARLKGMAAGWLSRRIQHVELSKDGITRLAFAIGQRISAGLVEQAAAKEALWNVYEAIADVQHADVDRAIEDGVTRGFDVSQMLLTLRCIQYPLTDFGIAECFRDRYGDNYRFTTAKGWVGWDDRRWKVLDQDEKTPPAEVIAAVFDTVRRFQDQARAIADTGIKFELMKDQKELQLESDNPHGLDRWIPKGKGFVRLSDMVKAFGRASETTGKPASVATLARRWLTVPIEQFDTDPLAIGVLNGTLRFERIIAADGTRTSKVELSGHRRADYNTKLAPIVYDPTAKAPLYDGMLEWAQPDAGMRRYLHQVGGYGATGLTVEHKLWFWYGRGRNGKSTTIDAWCHALGDYSGTTLIETFLDQGIKKRGDQASPDMARLGGIRMLRASEPERGAKLNSALIKFVTGGEPVPTRALHRGFFDLTPQFKLIIGGNSKPEIPDTDEGIWSRMKLVSWLKNIDLEFNPDGSPKKDPDLLNKIKAQETAGVFNRLVEGLLDYLANGLVEPAAVTADTQAYRDASDPLARFLRLCTVTEEDSSVQSSKLYEVFVAWCAAVGEREWKQKGFSNAMMEKGYTKHKASGMYWLKLRLVKAVSDFVDHEGKPLDLGAADDDDDAPGTGPPPSPYGDPDDDIPM
nr:phage/plasmid primase, P4 family [Sphingomonas sp. CROZ-RG-20F-R02-07]